MVLRVLVARRSSSCTVHTMLPTTILPSAVASLARHFMQFWIKANPFSLWFLSVSSFCFQLSIFILFPLFLSFSRPLSSIYSTLSPIIELAVPVLAPWSSIRTVHPPLHKLSLTVIKGLVLHVSAVHMCMHTLAANDSALHLVCERFEQLWGLPCLRALPLNQTALATAYAQPGQPGQASEIATRNASQLPLDAVEVGKQYTYGGVQRDHPAGRIRHGASLRLNRRRPRACLMLLAILRADVNCQTVRPYWWHI